ncbi:MAG: Tetratricopeptide 2, partial [Chthonomonadales bacterium]|nr:Tetratricopeptide 2 [Chthonomonadales bacterium]
MILRLALCLLLVGMSWGTTSGAEGADPPASATQVTEVNKSLNAGVDAHEHSDDKAAVKIWTEGLAKARSLGLTGVTARFLHNLALHNWEGGKYYLALNQDQEALKLRRSLTDQQAIAQSLNSVGNDYTGLARYGEALIYYNQALKIEQDGKFESDLTDTLTNIGNIYLYSGQWTQAEKTYKQALENYHGLHDKDSILDVRINLGFLYGQMGRVDEAILYLKGVLAEIPSGHKSARSNTLNHLGNIYFAQGNYTVALDDYTEALALARSIDAQDEWAKCLNNIAGVYAQTAQFAQSEEYYLQA